VKLAFRGWKESRSGRSRVVAKESADVALYKIREVDFMLDSDIVD